MTIMPDAVFYLKPSYRKIVNMTKVKRSSNMIYIANLFIKTIYYPSISMESILNRLLYINLQFVKLAVFDPIRLLFRSWSTTQLASMKWLFWILQWICFNENNASQSDALVKSSHFCLSINANAVCPVKVSAQSIAVLPQCALSHPSDNVSSPCSDLSPFQWSENGQSSAVCLVLLLGWVACDLHLKGCEVVRGAK